VVDERVRFFVSIFQARKSRERHERSSTATRKLYSQTGNEKENPITKQKNKTPSTKEKSNFAFIPAIEIVPAVQTENQRLRRSQNPQNNTKQYSSSRGEEESDRCELSMFSFHSGEDQF